ncbi:TNR25 factor, partial [Ardeotis kori]|nr:TNR25 factor [Ardeotis kori]
AAIPASPRPQVILAALCVAASGAQPPRCRDCAGQRGQQVSAQPPTRPRRHAARPSCPAGMNWIERAHRCCVRCPAGTFLHSPCSGHGNDSVCSPCPAGTFSAQPNTFFKCQACYECDRQGELAACRAMLCHAAACRTAHRLSPAAFQSVLSNCSATSNVACGCEPGHFRNCLDKRCSDFSCQPCQPCARRLIQWPCECRRLARGVPPLPVLPLARPPHLTPAFSAGSEAQDTLCGSCKPGFYAEGDECRPCHASVPEMCGKECQRVCNNGQGSGMQYVLLVLAGPFLLGALAIYRKRKRLRHSALASGPLPAMQVATPTAGAAAAPWCQVSAREQDSPCWTQTCTPQPTQMTEDAAGTARPSLKHQTLLREQPGNVARPGGKAQPSAPPEPPSTLLQGSQLYAVIDAVPVRRWKEFMRVLELREAEIELVELEVAHIRDQQYEMLKRWCQQTSATLDRVFTALERMELAGCAEALRRSL